MSLFRPEIEGMRALSIALVIAYHFDPTWLPGGFVGVDVFFVISGYLITLSLAHGHRAGAGWGAELAAFWARRMRRLLPNALLVLLVLGLVGALVLPDASVARLGEDIHWSAAYAINWLFVTRASDYLRWGETDASLLLNFWSLAVEEQFYLVWPVLLIAAWRLRPAAAPVLVTGPIATSGAASVAGSAARPALHLALALATASLLLALVQGRTQLAVAFFALPTRAWELLAGAALALATQGRPMPGWCVRPGPWMAAAGLAAIGAAAAGMSRDSAHPGLVTLLPVVGTLLVLAGMLARPQARLARIMGSAPLRAVGARSYSLYLWHWPVLTLGHALGSAVGAPKGAWLALAVLLSEAAYRWVESPARWRWAQRWSPRAVLALGLGASVVVAAFGAGLRWGAEQGLREGLVAAAPKPRGTPDGWRWRSNISR